jgi:allophanate hydrolase subunit 2
VWTTTALLDRIGARLDGPTLTRITSTEMPSEPLLDGAIQVPPDGQLIVMLRDHPTTGGYPVVAVVDPNDLHLVAQTPAGEKLRMIAGKQEQTPHRATGTVPQRRR